VLAPTFGKKVDKWFSQGYKVIMPQTMGTYGTDQAWRGTGMIVVTNQATGAALYVLYGNMTMALGGGTINTWPLNDYPDLWCDQLTGPITVTPPSPGDLYCAESNDILTFTVAGIEYFSYGIYADNCYSLGYEENVSFKLPDLYTIKYMADKWGPGEYTFGGADPGVTGCCSINPTKTVTIYKVDKLQYASGGGWQDIGAEPLYVLKGTMVNFKAVAAPAMTWPADMPIWGGSSGAIGTGETKSVTFNTESSSLTDYKTVTAGCMTSGTPTTVNVIVYDIDETNSIKPDDNFTGRSQTTYGLKETVKLKFKTTPGGISASKAGGVLWTYSGNGLVFDARIDGTAKYDAGGLTGTSTFIITVQSGPSSGQYKSFNRTIVAPSGTRMTRATGSVWHRQGYASAGILCFYWLDPVDVSFKNLKFGEGNCAPTGVQGVFGSYPNQPGSHPANPFDYITGGNLTTGCKVMPEDGARTKVIGSWVNGGSFTWSIPAQYQVQGGNWIDFGITDQTAIVFGPNSPPYLDGYTEQHKDGQWGGANVSDPDNELWWGN